VGFLFQQAHPQGRLNMMGKCLADMKQIGSEDVSKIGLDDKVC